MISIKKYWRKYFPEFKESTGELVYVATGVVEEQYRIVRYILLLPDGSLRGCFDRNWKLVYSLMNHGNVKVRLMRDFSRFWIRSMWFPHPTTKKMKIVDFSEVKDYDLL